uniref:C2H2-type domain-containing protein n=1 Tax=Strongyloides venezuelensis TaxID=75913 RepID=A0A0K0FKS7_STRVS
MDNSISLTKYFCHDCGFCASTEHEIILHCSCFSHSMYIPSVPSNDDGMELDEGNGNFMIEDSSFEQFSNAIWYFDNKENLLPMDFDFGKRMLKRKISNDSVHCKKMKLSVL